MAMSLEQANYCDNLKAGNIEVANQNSPSLSLADCARYTMEITLIDSNYVRLKDGVESYKESVKEVKSILMGLGK